MCLLENSTKLQATNKSDSIPDFYGLYGSDSEARSDEKRTHYCQFLNELVHNIMTLTRAKVGYSLNLQTTVPSSDPIEKTEMYFCSYQRQSQTR